MLVLLVTVVRNLRKCCDFTDGCVSVMFATSIEKYSAV